MKVTLVLLLLFIPSLAFGQIAGDIGKNKTFSDSKYPFSLSYSEKWLVTEKEPDETRLVLNYQSDDIVATFNINVIEAPELKSFPSEAFPGIMLEDEENLRKTIKEADENAEFQSAKEIKVNGFSALAITSSYSETIDGIKINFVMYQISLLFDGNMYTMTFGVEEEAYKGMNSEISNLYDSLTISNTVKKSLAKSG